MLKKPSKKQKQGLRWTRKKVSFHTWWIFSRVFFCTFREGTSEQNHPGYHEFMCYQVSVDSKHNTLSGLAFPLQPEATDAIREYSQGTKDYVQLAIGEESCCNCAKKATFLENVYPQIWPKRPSRTLPWCPWLPFFCSWQVERKTSGNSSFIRNCD